MQVGHGYDIHKLVTKRKLILGGIEIPYSKGLLGHSDGDILTHAIIDSLLGASGLGDIGQCFPDTDIKWKDANSLDLLELVYISLKNKGYIIKNIDATVVCEEPKLAPHIEKIKNKLAPMLALKPDQINIKAKTNEGLDSIGNKEAICAWAVALIE